VRRAAWILIGLVVAAALSVWVPSRIAERQVAAALRPHLEPTGSVQVRARTTAPAVVRGRIDRLHVEARAIRLGDLSAERLTATLVGVTLTRSSTNGRVIGQARNGDLTVEIGRGDLERFLRARGVENPVVTIDATGVMATGLVRAGALEVTARVRGQFYAASRRDLRFRVASIEVSGVELPPALAGTVLALVQPAVSLDGLPFPIAIDRVTSSDGRVVVHARVEGSGP
jgi:hypothetical protein